MNCYYNKAKQCLKSKEIIDQMDPDAAITFLNNFTCTAKETTTNLWYLKTIYGRSCLTTLIRKETFPRLWGALAPVSWMQIKKIEHRQPFYSLSGFTREVHIYNLQASWKVKWFYTHNHIINCIKDNLLNFLRGGLYIYHIAWFRTHRYSTH